ncbi:hypothetical protein HJC23_002816 [Cyclotella cryptica]|uniref:Uncharacterized protein n=1 Tax=Cyclotella cryptica TaxID=29204 RepID=A0ABD3PPJ1_9STRA|eukprot:CCRYP_013076-RA/>CCRYP_013076-RA protein AED:0.31 eAED:0.31 QI:0/-1/0/1/-1/1/1/0/242
MRTALLSLGTIISFLISSTNSLSFQSTKTTRKKWLSDAAALICIPAGVVTQFVPRVVANDDIDEQTSYSNPNVPAGPEERSGLVVLRVAEVAQFQEKILRAILNGDIQDVVVTPQQIVFGTQILLRNSNLAGNMKMMINNEIPRNNQREAAIKAANTMNALQKVSSTAAKVERELSPADYEELANLYRLVRVELNSLYELLPQKEKDKYYGYFVAVSDYEKKIAEGVYNPDLDGVLQFDYDK